MNNKSIRDYINLIENAQQGVEEGSYYTKGGTGQKSKWTVTLKNGKKKTINAATREGIKDFLTPEELIIGIKSAVKQQGVAEGELTTYLVSVMDASTKEHWRIEVKVTSPEAARERAEAMGYKVLGVKEKPDVAEEQLEETTPEAIKKVEQLVRK